MPRYDESSAQCLVFTFKDGLLSKIAHDLELAATRFHVDVADDGGSVQAVIDTASLRVVCAMKQGVEVPGELSDGDLRTIQGHLADDVLHTRKFPRAEFRSSAVHAVDGGQRLTGVLALHGVERPLSALVRTEGGQRCVEFSLHQPDFGIKPFSAMMGTLKIKPDVLVRVVVPAV